MTLQTKSPPSFRGAGATANPRLLRTAERIAGEVYGGKWTAGSAKPKEGATRA